MGIKVRYVTHAPVYTMEDCKAVDECIGGKNSFFPKNLFLCNRRKTAWYLYLTEGESHFESAVFSKRLGVTRLSFGDEENLAALLGVLPGAITPAGLLFDRENKVKPVAEKSILTYDEIIIHPCVNTVSIAFSMRDFFEKFLPYTGHELLLI